MKTYFILFSVFLCCLGGGDANAQNHHVAKVDSINSLPFVFITSNPETAEPLLLANSTLADSIGYTLGAARSHAQLGLVYNYLGKQDKRTEHILTSIRLYEEIDSMRLAGYQYTELGYGIKHRNLELAEEYMMKGITMLNAFPGSITQADAFNNYGIVKLMKHEYDSALLYVNRSLEIKQKANDQLGVSYSLGNLSEIYLGMGQYDDAIERLNNSYAIRENLKDSTAMGFDLLNLGFAYNKKENYSKAIYYFKKALNLALETDYTDLAERNYHQIALSFEQLAQYDSALFYQKKYTLYKDSLLNIATNSKVAELQVQFETEEKEKIIAQTNEALSIEQLKVRNRNWIVSVLILLFSSAIFITWLFIKQQRIKRENELRESELEVQLARAETENKLRKEKERISRDLHDNVGAQITNLIAGIEISEIHIKRKNKDAAIKYLKDLDEDARSTMTDLRETIWLLDNDKVTLTSFVDHLKQYINRQKKYLGGLKAELINNTEIKIELDANESLNLMRIIQEALNNTRKYAQATNFSIVFENNNQEVVVTIKDDGIGFDLESQTEYLSGNGLRNMKVRAQEIGGKLNIKSTAGHGVIITISIPK